MSIHEPVRQRVIDQIKPPGTGFLVHCNKYDSIDLVMLKTKAGIHDGEAEAAAQHKSLLSHFVLSDDKKFIRAIRTSDPSIRVFTSLHIIAWLDFANLIAVPDLYLIRLHKRLSFTNSELRGAYTDVRDYLGISISKKIIERKASLMKFGIK